MPGQPLIIGAAAHHPSGVRQPRGELLAGRAGWFAAPRVRVRRHLRTVEEPRVVLRSHRRVGVTDESRPDSDSWPRRDSSLVSGSRGSWATRFFAEGAVQLGSCSPMRRPRCSAALTRERKAPPKRGFATTAMEPTRGFEPRTPSLRAGRGWGLRGTGGHGWAQSVVPMMRRFPDSLRRYSPKLTNEVPPSCHRTARRAHVGDVNRGGRAPLAHPHIRGHGD